MPTLGLSNVGLADSYYRAPPGQGNGLIPSVVPYDPGFTIHFSVRCLHICGLQWLCVADCSLVIPCPYQVLGYQLMGSRYYDAYADIVG